MRPAEDWSRPEVEAAVSDYLQMLALELANEPFNKAERNRLLLPRLSARTRGSLEFKHQNISAVLQELGHPWIEGYKPATHFQRDLLFDVVADRLAKDLRLRALVDADLSAAAVAPAVTDLLSREVAPPDGAAQPLAHDGSAPPAPPAGTIDYLARETRNAALGRAGEEFVLRFERARLLRAGQQRLAADVQHLALEHDGAGFDILSFEEDARERLIEVKTTSYGRGTPFYVTRNELAVSQQRRSDYHLYRVFRFRRDPHLFRLHRALDQVCTLSASQYSARVG